ncbi:lipopolysaccharide biosynthesis protein [Arcticibacter sp.]|jgi:O-antigen/teichoic acid export membrane protein|uniref:lipopolysaccharide biosynthesis protein n=1 Tax=Arcticibacter sp. TaxID=1872630 RepID=UPI0038906BB8
MQAILWLYRTIFDSHTLRNSRTGKLLVNSVSSLALKGFSILTNFVMVPLCLRAVSEREYGLVLTITSIVNWIAFLDIGIGNGLRNKLSQAMAEGNDVLGRKYVSTAFYYITIIFSVLLLAYSLLHPYLNWYSLLGIQTQDVTNLSSCVYIVIAVFTIRFVLQLIGVVLLADQKVYLHDSIMPLSNVLSLGLIFAFYASGRANFESVMLAISCTPLLVLIFFNVYFFRGRYRKLRPSISQVDHTLRNELLSLGYRFFLLQICGLIIFSTSEILVARLMDLQSVTVFNITSRYFGISFLLANMVMASLWSAFSSAWFQRDFAWIHGIIRKMHFINIGFICMNVVLFFFFRPLTQVWLGRELVITDHLALAMIVYNAQLIFNNVFSMFLNSTGILNLQLVSGVIGAVINIPLTILLIRHTNLGLTAVCLANIISLLPGSVMTSIQTYHVLKLKGAEANE